MPKKYQKNMESLFNILSEILMPVFDEEQMELFKNEFHKNEMKFSKFFESKKKKKDPDAPKRGKSSYIFFCIKNRPEIKEKHPEMSATEITVELGKKWRNLSDTQKKPFIKLAEEDKERYRKEIENYTPPEGSETKKKVKRQSSPYIYFCKEKRSGVKKENPKMSATKVTSVIAEMWNKLDDEEKTPYVELAKQDKERFSQDKSVDKFVDKSTKKSKDKRKTGYILYCQENREKVEDENSDWSSQEVTKELDKRWKKMSKKAKEKYTKKAVSV